MIFNKHAILFFILSLLLFSCYSLKRSIKEGEPYNKQINWPEAYALDQTQFYIHNKIEINANPEVVWDILINAEAWPTWYKGMENVKILDTNQNRLISDSKLSFKTMGNNFQAQIIEYQPYEKLSWETKNKNLQAVHAWLIIPTEKGCLVVTDESQYGLLAKLQKIFLPKKLKKLHDVWLTELKKKAENNH